MPTPYYEHQGVTIYHGDCLEVLPELDTQFTACITDPPYGLNFMGKEWDHGVPGVPFWEAIKRVLKPGAPLFAFSGTRTFHRQWCYIEDAGFTLKDTLSYMYGTGFPKSHDISKAIDDKKGAEREDLGPNPNGVGRNYNKTGGNYGNDHEEDRAQRDRITAPATEDAERWDGWGSALKPSWEPICYATKPRDGTYAENALEYGVAGLNIDAVRIDHNEPIKKTERDADRYSGRTMNNGEQGGKKDDMASPNQKGRWPPNTVLDERAAKILDAQTGTLESGDPIGQRNADGYKGRFKGNGAQLTGYGDEGGASRFFYTSKASKDDRTKGMPDGTENPHPTVKSTDLIGWLCKLASYPGRNHILDPFAGSGPLAYVAAQLGYKATLIEQDEESAELCALRLQGQQALFASPGF